MEILKSKFLQNQSPFHTTTWKILTDIKSKRDEKHRRPAVRFHLYEVQEQPQLVYAEIRSMWGGAMDRKTAPNKFLGCCK